MPPIDNTTKILLLVIVCVFACLLLAWFVRKLNIFLNDLRYVNMEIGRNEGEDKEFWIRKKKHLWKVFLPFRGD